MLSGLRADAKAHEDAPSAVRDSHRQLLQPSRARKSCGSRPSDSGMMKASRPARRGSGALVEWARSLRGNSVHEDEGEPGDRFDQFEPRADKGTLIGGGAGGSAEGDRCAAARPRTFFRAHSGL